MSQVDQADDKVQVPDFISMLPERIWYLTGDGQNMWARRPYGFFFSSAEAAERFAAQMGTQLTLQAIGLAALQLVSAECVAALRRMEVTRLFLDPQIDPDSGDVHGRILRLAAMD